jgi:hypothetical protein
MQWWGTAPEVVHNDDVDVRDLEKLQEAVSVAHWQHHEQENRARKSPLMKI